MTPCLGLRVEAEKEGRVAGTGCSPHRLLRLVSQANSQNANEIVGGVEDTGYGDLLAEVVRSEALIIDPEEARVGGVAQDDLTIGSSADGAGDVQQGPPDALLRLLRCGARVWAWGPCECRGREDDRKNDRRDKEREQTHGIRTQIFQTRTSDIGI